MPIIETESLTKTYPGGIEAVRGVSFSVEEGEIFALLGPNGAGKSTTMRMLATLSRPTAGHASVAGHDIVAEPADVRRSIGYVGQASTVDQQLTGAENLALQGRLFGLGGRSLRDRVDELLTLMGLTDAAGRLTRTYSGGMRRRLDLAMGLIHGPRLLFLDEPSAGLDPESRAVVWREVERLAREAGITVLMTTHYLEEADRLARRIAIIDHGAIVARGAPDVLKDSLKGDMITLVPRDPAQCALAQELLEALGSVDSALVEDGRVHARVANGAAAIPEVVSALSGVALAEVTLSRPSLDDVYLSVTGRSFDSADAEGRKAAAKSGRAS